MAEAVLGFDRTLGALLLASWLNCSLFTIETMQIHEYWTRFWKRDSWFNKACVASALLTDTCGMVAVTSAVYQYTITHFGDVAYAQSQPWSMPLYVCSSGVSGAITQTFLSLRIWRLTGQPLYPIVFGAISAASLAGALGTAIQVVSAVTYADRAKLSTMVTIWLSCAAAVDLLIASALVYILASKTSTTASFKSTDSLLKRLMVDAVKTGSVTAGAAIIALVLFTWSPVDNLCVFFSLSLGRLYTISMLSNLNARNSNEDTGRGPSSGNQSDHGRSESRFNGGRSRNELRGVKIERDVVTRVDNSDDYVNDGSIGLSNRDVKQKTYDEESATPAVAYQTSNHKDEWESRSLEDSQVDLVDRVRDGGPGNYRR